MILMVIVSGCAFISMDMAKMLQLQPLEERVILKGSDDKVLVVEILGPISTTSIKKGYLPSQGTLERLDCVFKKAEKDREIKGIILRIDSPGGGVSASDLVYRRITRFKTSRAIPVVACITNQGTSGAYMVALAADRICAGPTSIVGNIGVIIPSISVEGLMDKLGIANQTVKSGRFKDTGNPMRDMSPDDREIIKGIVMEFYEKFLSMVKDKRPVTQADLKHVGDGRIMSASEAKKYHLIDRVGYLEETMDTMDKLAGTDKPTLIVYRRGSENHGGFYSWP